MSTRIGSFIPCFRSLFLYILVYAKIAAAETLRDNAFIFTAIQAL